MIDALVERGFAVHAPLLTGHGTHPGKLQDVTFDEIVADMEKELDGGAGHARARRHRGVLAREPRGDRACGAPARRAARARAARQRADARRPRERRARPDRSARLEATGLVPPQALVGRRARSRAEEAHHRRTTAIRSARRSRSIARARACARGSARSSAPRSSCTARAIASVPSSNVALAASALGSRDVRTRIYAKSAHLDRRRPRSDEVAEAVTSFVGSLARTLLASAAGRPVAAARRARCRRDRTTSTSVAISWRANTICAMRSSGAIVTGSVPRLTSTTAISPR